MAPEDEKKPVTITLKVTIPTRESIVTAIKQLFPLLEVTVEEEKKPPQPGPTSAPIDVESLEPEEAPPVKPEG